MRMPVCMRIVIMFACLLCLTVCVSSAEEVIYQWTAKDSAVVRYDVPMTATVKGGAYIVGGSGMGRSTLTRVSRAASAVVLGEEDGYYLLDCGTTRGYVAKDKVTIDGEMARASSDTAFSAALTDYTRPSLLHRGTSMIVKGEIHTNLPITSVSITVFNVRSMTEDMGVCRYFDYAENVTAFKLGQIGKLLNFSTLKTGERTLTVTVSSGDQTVTLSETYLYIRGRAQPLPNANDGCRFSTGGGNAKYLFDDNYDTSWTPADAQDAAVIEIPANMDAGLIKVEWTKGIRAANAVMLGADGSVIKTADDAYPYDFYETCYELPEGVKTLIVKPMDLTNGIAEIRVYRRGAVSPLVSRWEPLPDKVDMMLVVAHRNDETLYFSGTGPYLYTREKSLSIVCMTACKSRKAYAECLEAVWSLGVKYHPMFLGFVDEKGTYDIVMRDWGRENAYEKLITLIRRYKPDVMLTHDIKGEFGHQQHIFTCEAVRDCALLAGDPTRNPESASAYGVWNVYKVYIHIYRDVPRLGVPYRVPFTALGGMTPWEMAVIAMDKHIQPYYLDGNDPDGIRYDCTWFGLYYSTVGPDVINNDFFENIPERQAS